jgi:two-component system NarL family response regulator
MMNTISNTPTSQGKASPLETALDQPAPHSISETKPIRVLIADDHTVVLEGLVAMINRQPDMCVVAEASNGRDAVELWKKHSPDVTLLDLRMPQLDGVGAIHEIRKQDASARIIVLTTYDGDAQICEAMRAGAKAYLLKDARREELLQAMRRVYSGEICVSPAQALRLAEHMTTESLSKRELDVVALLAHGKSNKEIGEELHISETTVKSHVKSVFAKLNVFSRTEAVTTAVQRGLIQL